MLIKDDEFKDFLSEEEMEFFDKLKYNVTCEYYQIAEIDMGYAKISYRPRTPEVNINLVYSNAESSITGNITREITKRLKEIAMEGMFTRDVKKKKTFYIFGVKNISDIAEIIKVAEECIGVTHLMNR